MKIIQASYKDDGVIVPGILVKRFLRKPVFYAADPNCGWHSQVITKQNKGVIMLGGCGSGKSRRFCNTQGASQSNDELYREVIKSLSELTGDELVKLIRQTEAEIDRRFNACFEEVKE